MKRSSKLMLACAIGAVAVLVAAGAARIALAPDTSRDEVGNAPQAEAVASSWASYLNTSWHGKEDPKLQLSIIDGALVETRGSEVSITYVEVGEATEERGGLTVQVEAKRKLNEAAKQGVLRIDKSAEEELLTADCLEFADAYVRDAVPVRSLKIAGDTSKLEEAMGVPCEQIRAALAAHASKSSPYATAAAWDMEVFTDYGKGMSSTTFTLDDTASTIVTVTVNAATGEIEVL